MLKKFLTELARAIGRRNAIRQQAKTSLLIQQSQDIRLAGNADLAAEFAQKAIRSDPSNPQAHYFLGRAYIDQGRFSEAASAIEKVIQFEPRYAIALQDLGNVYRILGQNEKATTCYQSALQIDDGLTLTWLNMGLLLADSGQNSEALVAVTRALDQVPTLIEGLKFLVGELTKQERFEEALEYLFRANERQPNSADILNGIGFVLQKHDRAAEAITYYEQGIHISPENAELWGNLGIAYQDLMRLDDAIAAYECAQELRPEWLVPRWHRSLAYLLRGDSQRGWKDYELRLLPTQTPKPREFPFERWLGESTAGKSILIYGEQGVGDEIMFASCIPDLLKQSEQCMVECSHKLAPIFRRSFPSAEVIGTNQGQDMHWLESARKIDLCIPIGSLPLYFRRSPHEFPATNSYLTADEASVAHWRQELDQLGPGLKVGISWKGGTVISRKNARSIALKQWLPILTRANVHFVSLQYGGHAAELEALRLEHGIQVHHWEQAIQDYDQTAALVCALDMVISVTTAIIHLTGALGRKAWVLVPVSPAWRYGAEGERMLWYPTVRLFRQKIPDQWEPVILQVSEALDQLANTS